MAIVLDYSPNLIHIVSYVSISEDTMPFPYAVALKVLFLERK